MLVIIMMEEEEARFMGRGGGR